MTDDDPFASGAAGFAAPEEDVDTLAPVPLEPRAILERAWKLFTEHPGTVLGAVLIPLVPTLGITGVQQVTTYISSNTDAETWLVVLMSLVSLGLSLLSALVGVFFQLGQVRIFGRLARGQGAGLGLLFGGLPNVPYAIAMTIVLSVVLVVGLLLCVVPGVIASIGLQFSVYALVHQRLGPIEALQESWRLTMGNKVTLFVIALVFFVAAMTLTCVTCGVGALFLVLPVGALAQGVMYHSLVHLQAPRP